MKGKHLIIRLPVSIAREGLNYGLAHARPYRWLYPIGFILLLALVSLSSALHPSALVTVSLEGEPFQVKTHLGKVETILREAGVKVGPDDVVSPPLNARVGDGDTIAIKQTKPLVLVLPDKTVTTRTAAETIGEALNENGIVLSSNDILLKDGSLRSREEPLSARDLAQSAHSAALDSTPLRPYGQATNRGGYRPGLLSTTQQTNTVTLQIKRAVPLQIHDAGLSTQILTTEATLGQALDSTGITLNPGDLVTPSPETGVQAGMHIYIQRSKGITINADGSELAARTFAETVAQALQERGIRLSELDRVEPDLDTTIRDGLAISITRIVHELVTSEEAIPFSSELRPDPELEIDHQQVTQSGMPGLFKRLTRVIYENGEEKESIIEREWVESAPEARITSYGTKIVVREIDTPEGRLTYWRKLRVYATWYNASHGGKTRDDPRYGFTYLGLKAERGIVAVDPNVIPFYTKMYVPGYGIGLAADTGGGIKGRWIDLCYEEGDTGLWGARWVDIYLLAPPPNSIRWILP